MSRNIKKSYEEHSSVRVTIKSQGCEISCHSGWIQPVNLSGERELSAVLQRRKRSRKPAKPTRNPTKRWENDTVTLELRHKMIKYSVFLLLHVLRRSPEANVQCFPPDLVSFHNKSTEERVRVKPLHSGISYKNHAINILMLSNLVS